MPHPILKILNERRQGKVVGIPSYCTANRKVIETILRDAAKHGRTVLIEATAKQVDQFGGYTGMKPKNYVRFIEEIAAQTGCDMRQILLGGDHLGPLTFCKEPEAAAMDKAEALDAGIRRGGLYEDSSGHEHEGRRRPGGRTGQTGLCKTRRSAVQSSRRRIYTLPS